MITEKIKETKNSAKKIVNDESLQKLCKIYTFVDCYTLEHRIKVIQTLWKYIS